jgi:hypothetical protein
MPQKGQQMRFRYGGVVRRYPNLSRWWYLGWLMWDKGTVGDGDGYSNQVSVSFGFAWYDLWLGAYLKPETFGWIIFVCLVPCLPIRIHWQWSYAGRYT